MRLRHPSGRPIFLSSGIAAPPTGDLHELIASLDRYATVRERLDAATLGVSPWFPPPVAQALAGDARARVRLRRELDVRGLEVVTVDGVAWRQAAENVAKSARYQPDWTTVERLEYTLDLARVLVDLMPEDAVRGSVSTLALGAAETWHEDRAKAAARILRKLSGGLAEIAWRTGRAVRVGFQPEPGCAIDSARSAASLLSRVDNDRLGICLDTANLACAWEEPADALGRLVTAGLAVVRVQVTAAIEAQNPTTAVAALRGYVEPRHAHQTQTATGVYAEDLAQALGDLPPGPWRVRYQVPLNAAPAAPLTATTDVWRGTLRELVTGALPGCDHVVVATESWDVLPPQERPSSLTAAVTAEFAYARDELAALGLKPAVCA